MKTTFVLAVLLGCAEAVKLTSMTQFGLPTISLPAVALPTAIADVAPTAVTNAVD